MRGGYAHCCTRGMAIEWIGWLSATILLITLGRQVYTQWRTRTAAGVPRWLFVGLVFASTGFVIYSALIGSAVFVVANVLVLAAALIGQYVASSNRRRERYTRDARVVQFVRRGPRVRSTDSKPTRSPGR